MHCYCHGRKGLALGSQPSLSSAPFVCSVKHEMRSPEGAPTFLYYFNDPKASTKASTEAKAQTAWQN